MSWLRGSTFSHRAASIGVSVKLTTSDTMIANAIVRPKLFMNRPTMPPMNADRHEDRDERERGRQHGEADLLVAATAAWTWSSCLLFDEPVDVLQHDDGVVDDDADRQVSARASSAC